MPSVRYSIDARGAEDGARRFTGAIDRVVADARRAQTAFEAMDRAMSSLRGTAAASNQIANFARTIQRIPAAANPARASVSSFAVGMRDLGSASVLAFGPLSGIGSRFSAIGALSARSNLALGASIGVITGLGVVLASSIKSAADFEEGMLRVAKVTNLSGEGLKSLSAELLKMSSTLGVPATELASIAERGAQMGKDFLKTTADIALFTEQVAILTKTTNLGAAGAEAAAASLGRFLQLTGSGVGATKGFVAAIVDVGNKFNATESEILKITEELARSGTAFKVGGDQLLALGAAMASMGEHAERGGTALSQTLVRITQVAEGGGQKLTQFAHAVGLTEEQFKEMSHTDIGGVFQRLLATLRDAGPGASQILKDLHIGSERNVKVFLALAQNLDKFNGALAAVQGQIANPTAAMTEFQKMAEGTNFQLSKTWVEITNLGILLGDRFLPTVNSTLKGLNEFLMGLQGIGPQAEATAGSVKTMTTEVVTLSGALPGLAVALGLVLLPFAPLTGAMLAAGGAFVAFKRMMADFDVAPIALVSTHAESAQSALAGLTAEAGHAAAGTTQVAAAADHAGAAYDRNAEAVDKVIGKLKGQVLAQQQATTGGQAAAKAQEEINKLEQAGYTLSKPQKDAILAQTKALFGLKDGIKAAAKEGKDSQKAFEDLSKGLNALGRELDKEIKTTGLTDAQKATVELQAKIEDLRAKYLETGADAPKALELIKQKTEELLGKQVELNASKAKEFQNDALKSLERQIELRQIEITQGAAAAKVQEVVNDAKDKGITLEDGFTKKLLEGNEALAKMKDASTVMADAFEDFISGIAAGTQDLSFDGITDALKSAFAASVKEKLNFDDIFKHNMLDLVGFASDLFSGNGINVAGLFNFSGLGGGAGGAGGGGGILGGVGGSLLGTVLPLILGGGPGAALGLGSPGVSIGLSGLSLLNSGVGLANGGVGLIGTLFGSGASTSLASIVGPEVGGHIANGIDAIFGPGSGANTLMGDLGPVVGGAGAVLGAAGGAFATWNLVQGGQSGIEIAASLLAIVAGGAAVLNAFGPIGTIIYAIVLALTAIASALTDITPTAGTLRRRAAESAVDAIKTFDELQKSMGDISRHLYNVHSNPDLPKQREKIGEQGVTDITGFATLFAQVNFGDSFKSGKDHVASIAQEWTNIFTEFFSRLDADSEEASKFIREKLLAAFKDMGINTADQAFDLINKAAANFKLSTDFNYFQEPIDQVAFLGTAVRGVADVFESELPPGVHLAALAMANMTKDGQKAFADLDQKGRETLQNLAEDGANFDKIMGQLFAQGYTIDTEEFKKQLQALVESAKFVGENIAEVFKFEDIGNGIQGVMQKLKETVLGAFKDASLKQLFEKTDIASVFQPVFAALDRIDEFDLTTATGSQGFMDMLMPALAAGEANLKDYIPVLKIIAENWKEISDMVDEAMKPDRFEQAAAITEQAFGGIGQVLQTSIEAGVAVLEAGGTWDDAVKAFNNTFGPGVEQTLKKAIFDAIIQSAVIEPLLATFGPAFQYVIAVGMELGFNDPRVKAAMGILLGQVESAAEKLGLVVFEAQIDSDQVLTGWQKALNDAAPIVEKWAQGIQSSIESALGAAFDIIDKGGSIQEATDAWTEGLGDSTGKSVLRGIVMAMIQAEAIEPFIKKHAAEMQYITAAALEFGVDDPRVKKAMETVFGPNSDFQHELQNLGPYAIQLYATIVGPDGQPLPDANLTAHGGDIVHSARGGSFGANGMTWVGEEGQELVVGHAGGFTVIPMDHIGHAATGGRFGRAQSNVGNVGGNSGSHVGDVGGSNVPGGTTDPGYNVGNVGGGRKPPNTYYPGGFHGVGDNYGRMPGWGTGDGMFHPDPNPTHTGDGDGAEKPKVLVSLDFSSAIDAFAHGGTQAELEKAFAHTTGEGILKGMQEGMLEGLMMDDKLKALSDLIRKSMKDGLDPKEIEEIKAMGNKISSEVADATVALGPAFDAVSEAFGIKTKEEIEGIELDPANMAASLAVLGPAFHVMTDGVAVDLQKALTDAAQKAAPAVGEMVGSSLKGLLSDPKKLNFESFSQGLRSAIFQNVAGGLIDAFVQSAVIQGALAPMMGAIALIFDQIAHKQLTVAEANGLIVEQIALINGVLDDPAFKAAIDTMVSGIASIGKNLDAFPPAAAAATDAATGVSEAVTDAQKDVCTGQCELEKQVIDYGAAAMNDAGRMGDISDTVYRNPAGGHGSGSGGPVYGYVDHDPLNGEYGAGNDTEWRRSHRWHRREAKHDNEPGYYGPLASGGIAMHPGYALIAEAEPEVVAPLAALSAMFHEAASDSLDATMAGLAASFHMSSSSGGVASDGVAADVLNEIKDLLQASGEDQKDGLQRLSDALENQDLTFHSYLGMEKFATMMAKGFRVGKQSGIRFDVGGK